MYILLSLTWLSLSVATAQTKSRDSVRFKPIDSLDRSQEMMVKNDKTVAAAEPDIDPESIVRLKEVLLIPPYKFKSRLERRKYLILRKKTKHVWPYAILAAERLNELSLRLEHLEYGYKKSEYVKIVQRYIENEFKEELKKLTKTEGQILVKLMHRQIGKTTFEIIQDLRSGWRAFWYNTTANLFSISLKEEYQPSSSEEDYLIEYILRRAFQSGELEPHDPAIDINFQQLLDNH